VNLGPGMQRIRYTHHLPFSFLCHWACPYGEQRPWPPDHRDAIDVAGEITEDRGGATVSAGASAEVTGASIVYELVVAGTSSRHAPSSLRFALVVHKPGRVVVRFGEVCLSQQFKRMGGISCVQ
jgi:hypothetical protein